MSVTFDPSRRLTPHFTWRELVATNHRNLYASNAAESTAVLDSLTATCELLELVRAHFDAPVVVHSGYRGLALNRTIGGSRSSQHMRGESADCHVVGVGLHDVFAWMRDESGIHYGQLILEGSIPEQPTWLHISLGAPWRPPERSGQAMTWDRVHGYRHTPRRQT